MNALSAARFTGLCAIAVAILAIFPGQAAHAAMPGDLTAEDLAKNDLVTPPSERTLDELAPVDTYQREDALLERALTEGTVPVIVLLREPEESDGRRFALGAENRRNALAMAQRRVLDSLPRMDANSPRGKSVKQFEEVPAFAMQADAMDIAGLLNNPDVLEVQEDVAYPPGLANSTTLLGAGPARDYVGYSGAGQVVAVLDTGVAKTHPFLTGKVVSEACYSTTYSPQGIASLCPGGVAASTTAGSGVNCDISLSGCNHGTHVAGIAAGKGSSYSGVARDAQIVAIQVFSRFPASMCGGSSPCVMAYTSDIIRGLERVRALTASYSIAAANMSLGGGGYGAACDSDPTKPAIDALRAVGVATVIASGNSGYSNALGAPACISSAVSVGSTTSSDQVSSFSNSASFLSLLAPGSSINSSVPGNGYGTMSGTSMASPHVAGAWAVLKSAQPAAGVTEILSALQLSGLPVLDPDNGLVKPRIRVAEAIARLESADQDPAPIAAPVANAPTVVTASGFTASWAAATGATGYRLDVSTNSSFSAFVNGFQDIDVGAATSRSVGGLSASTTYYYRVRAVGSEGVSASSNVRAVTTLAAVPAIAQITGASAITANGFTLNWVATQNATGYLVDVATNSTFRTFVTGYKARNVGNVTSLPVSGLKANTLYYVRVRAYNAQLLGAYSATAAVRTMILVPAASASSSITVSGFNANWRAVTGATGYRLDVATDSGFANMLSGYANRDVGKVTRVALAGLTHGSSYYYRVRAYSAAGTTASSAVVAVTTRAMTTPVASAASSITKASFSANWRAVSGAVSYSLEVATDSGFNNLVSGYAGRNVGKVTRTTITGLQSGTTYYYRVRASSGPSLTGASNVATVRTR